MTAEEQQDKARRRALLRASGFVRTSDGAYRKRITKAHNERPIRLARERRLAARPGPITGGGRRGYQRSKFEVVHKRPPIKKRIKRALKRLFQRRQ